MDAHTAVNVRGTLMLSVEFARRTEGSGWGRIISLVSGQDRSGEAENLPYGATKGGHLGVHPIPRRGGGTARHHGQWRGPGADRHRVDGCDFEAGEPLQVAPTAGWGDRRMPRGLSLSSPATRRSGLPGRSSTRTEPILWRETSGYCVAVLVSGVSNRSSGTVRREDDIEAEGLSNPEVARRLGLSSGTVKHHAATRRIASTTEIGRVRPWPRRVLLPVLIVSTPPSRPLPESLPLASQ